MNPFATRIDTTRRLGGLGAFLATAAIIAACSSQTGGGATNPPAATTAPAAGGGPVTLALTMGTVGDYVTGKDGLSLYVFSKDTTPGTSACTGNCAGSWPALTVTAASDVTLGTGVTGTVGTITRDDGKLQVTLNGHPLYYFSGDTKAGDTKGQGLNSVWYLSSPTGSPVGASSSATQAPAATPAASKCTSYCY